MFQKSSIWDLYVFYGHEVLHVECVIVKYMQVQSYPYKHIRDT